MTRPILVAGDAQLALKAYLTTVLAGRDEDYLDGVTVSVRYPDGSTGAPSVPHVQVRHDGTPAPGRVRDVVQLGIGIYLDHDQPVDAKAAANLIAGIVDAHSGDDVVASFRVNAGPLVGVDPETKLTVATLGVRAITKKATVAA